jgi:maltose/maltodextrin transport system substrate-binding protein
LFHYISFLVTKLRGHIYLTLPLREHYSYETFSLKSRSPLADACEPFCMDERRTSNLDGSRPRTGSRTTDKKIRARSLNKIAIQTPTNITANFPIMAQVGKGPDIVIWAHDKVGEWADAGLIAPVDVSDEFADKFFPKAWEAVMHNGLAWAYPIAMETVTLIYNKRLLSGEPPTDLSQLPALDEQIRSKQPAVRTILWDYQSAYYSLGIFASAGAYIFRKKGTNYDLANVGLATPGAVQALSQIISLVKENILPPSVSYSQTEELMGQGKLAMTISGPWAWSNLIRSGISFGVAPMPGVNGNRARPFVGVSAAYVNRASLNVNLIQFFLQNYLLTDEWLNAMNQVKPIGVPAVTSLYEKLANRNPLVRDLNRCVMEGEVMPNIPEMGQFFSALGGAIQVAAQNRLSPQIALEDAAAQLRQERHR